MEILVIRARDRVYKIDKISILVMNIYTEMLYNVSKVKIIFLHDLCNLNSLT